MSFERNRALGAYFRWASASFLLFTVACGSSDQPAPSGHGGAGGGPAAGFSLTSSVFHDGEMIPAEYRCQAPSPDLSWSGEPDGTTSFAVVFRDVTPGVSDGFLHWILFDVPPGTLSLSKGVPVGYSPPEPAGAHQGAIWNGTKGFNGPCGGMNTYELTVYALNVDAVPGVDETTSGDDLVRAIIANELDHVMMTVKSRP